MFDQYTPLTQLIGLIVIILLLFVLVIQNNNRNRKRQLNRGKRDFRSNYYQKKKDNKDEKDKD